jgi:hypothetical protein
MKPSHGEVARRAYELFLARGAQHGADLHDWLEAERQLMSGVQRSPKKPTATSSRRRN